MESGVIIILALGLVSEHLTLLTHLHFVEPIVGCG